MKYLKYFFRKIKKYAKGVVLMLSPLLFPILIFALICISEGYTFEDKVQSPYTLWDASKVHYKKGNMIKKNREPNPSRCFALRYNGKDINIGGFLEFYSAELINDLIVEFNE